MHKPLFAGLTAITLNLGLLPMANSKNLLSCPPSQATSTALAICAISHGGCAAAGDLAENSTQKRFLLSEGCGSLAAEMTGEGYGLSDFLGAGIASMVDSDAYNKLHDDDPDNDGAARFEQLLTGLYKAGSFLQCVDKVAKQCSQQWRLTNSHETTTPRYQESARPTTYENYKVLPCGSIIDLTTGLEWYVGPDQTLAWAEAKQWTANLDTCGGNWRMPTIAEIKSLYRPAYSAGTGFYINGKYWPAHIHPVFDAIGQGSWVWSNQSMPEFKAKSVNLNQGLAVTYNQSGEKYTTRVFAVR
ncbi:Lcl C-terminal domain-containing protein [Methylovulum psychrotolerans]|nr:DUF1566 domain-containing protein [Methylovulum psychrotolerans]